MSYAVDLNTRWTGHYDSLDTCVMCEKVKYIPIFIRYYPVEGPTQTSNFCKACLLECCLGFGLGCDVPSDIRII